MTAQEKLGMPLDEFLEQGRVARPAGKTDVLRSALWIQSKGSGDPFEERRLAGAILANKKRDRTGEAKRLQVSNRRKRVGKLIR